jgi:hypothetical protein
LGEEGVGTSIIAHVIAIAFTPHALAENAWAIHLRTITYNFAFDHCELALRVMARQSLRASLAILKRHPDSQ